MKVLACTLGVILATVSWSAPAAALDITFDDVMSVGNPLVTVLETAGYRFTAASFRTIDTPGGTFVTNGSAVYVAQEAGRPGGITMTRIDGGPFFLYEFDAAGLFVTPPAASSNAQQVSLLGLQAGGAFLSASYGLSSGLASFAHFVVPEPRTLLLALTTAVGVGALALRRGPRTPVRRR